MVVVAVLPLAGFVVEELGVVDDEAVEQSVELFGVDAVGSLHFAGRIKTPCFRLNCTETSPGSAYPARRSPSCPTSGMYPCSMTLSLVGRTILAVTGAAKD
jgi:hypothetical protein